LAAALQRWLQEIVAESVDLAELSLSIMMNNPEPGVVDLLKHLLFEETDGR
jgi:hypothetical protein